MRSCNIKRWVEDWLASFWPGYSVSKQSMWLRVHRSPWVNGALYMGPNVLRAALATEIDEREDVKKEGARDLDFGLWNALSEMSCSSWFIKVFFFPTIFVFLSSIKPFQLPMNESFKWHFCTFSFKYVKSLIYCFK